MLLAEVRDELEVAMREQLDGWLVGRMERRESVPSEADQRQFVTYRAAKWLELRSQAMMLDGGARLSTAAEDDLVSSVRDLLFSPLARLDHLFAPGVTDVSNSDGGQWFRDWMDGRREFVDNPFPSRGAIIEAAKAWARRAGVTGEQSEFTEASPFLDLVFGDGSRLTAVGWLSETPKVHFRRPAPPEWELEDLERLGMFGRDIRLLLTAVVRSGMSVLVAARSGAGKTTLLRCMAHVADPAEYKIVIEQDPELMLRQSRPDLHPLISEFWGRQPNMDGAGGVTMADLAMKAKRLKPDRIIVGEVLGGEAVDLLEVMSQGVPGMCTLHSSSAAQVWDRLVLYARKSGYSLTRADVLGSAGMEVDVVIHLGLSVEGRRVVREIHGVHGYNADLQQVTTAAWYVPGPDGAAVPNPDAWIAEDFLTRLEAVGFDPAARFPKLWRVAE
jgi:pilus assembly protein CpaF